MRRIIDAQWTNEIKNKLKRDKNKLNVLRSAIRDYSYWSRLFSKTNITTHHVRIVVAFE